MAWWKQDRRGSGSGASADALDENDPPVSRATPVLEGERGIPPVNQRSFKSRSQFAIIAIGVLMLLLLMWLLPGGTPTPKTASNDPRATKNQRFDEGRPNTDLLPAQAQIAAAPAPFVPPKPPEPLAQPVGPQIVPAIDPRKAPAAGNGGSGPRELTPLEKRMRSRTIIQDRGQPASNQMPAGAPTASPVTGGGAQADAERRARDEIARLMAGSGGATIPAGPEGGERPASAAGASSTTVSADENSVAAQLKPTRLDGVSATVLPSRSLMLARGKMIDCILDTAISTVVAGMTKCTLSRDVYSEDGKVILLDRGTELTGDYRSNMRPGQTRLGILWARAKTTKGVLIELASPASDPLGRAGVDGVVENHFWERYGAAILLSSLDDTLAIIAAREQSKSSGSIIFPPSTTRTGKEAASVALENNIKIPPTLIKNQGEHINVFVARDLDFRSVYNYRPAEI